MINLTETPIWLRLSKQLARWLMSSRSPSPASSGQLKLLMVPQIKLARVKHLPFLLDLFRFFLPRAGDLAERLTPRLDHPWAILFFYDTHDISRYFNMMQYIAIFSRYFPGVKLVKKMCNFLQMLSWEHSCWDFATKTPYFVFLRQKWPNLCFSAKKIAPLKV